MFNTVKRAVPVVAVLGAGMVWMTIGTTAQSSSMPSTRARPAPRVLRSG